MRNLLSRRLPIASALLFISVLVVILGQRGTLTPVRNAFGTVMAPFQTWGAGIFYAIRGDGSEVTGDPEIDQQIADLEAEVERLRNENAELKEIQAKARILEEQLDYAIEYPDRQVILADVIGRDPSPFLNFLIVNKGRNDGVEVGQTVVTSSGLVGVVQEAPTTYSKVLLITDPSMRVNVRLQDARADGLLIGQTNEILRLQFIQQESDAGAGEVVVTSGLGANYPPGIPVGTVSSVRFRESDVFREAEVKPFTDFERLEVVQIISNFTPLDIKDIDQVNQLVNDLGS